MLPVRYRLNVFYGDTSAILLSQRCYSLEIAHATLGIDQVQGHGQVFFLKQAVSKTPDADSLQQTLGYFERVARLRLVTKSDAEFRKWLRMPHPEVDGKNPLELLAKGEWQAVADFVDDILIGTPG